MFLWVDSLVTKVHLCLVEGPLLRVAHTECGLFFSVGSVTGKKCQAKFNRKPLRNSFSLESIVSLNPLISPSLVIITKSLASDGIHLNLMGTPSCFSPFPASQEDSNCCLYYKKIVIFFSFLDQKITLWYCLCSLTQFQNYGLGFWILGFVVAYRNTSTSWALQGKLKQAVSTCLVWLS